MNTIKSTAHDNKRRQQEILNDLHLLLHLIQPESVERVAVVNAANRIVWYFIYLNNGDLK